MQTPTATTTPRFNLDSTPKRSLRKRLPLLLGASSLALCLGATSSQAMELFDGRMNVNAYLMQGFQAIEADDGAFEAVNENMDNGFQRLRFNLELSFQITEYISAFVDLAEEPNDFGGNDPFFLSQDLGYIDFDVLGLAGKSKPGSKLTFRAGNIVSTVFEFRGFTDGAAVQSNPLIGNSPADMVTAESGVQLLWTQALQHDWIDRWNADIGVSVPTFFEDYGSDRGYNVYGRFSFNTDFGLDLGLGWFVSDLAGQLDTRDFADVQLPGLIFGDAESYNFQSSSSSNRDTHAGLVPGLEASILQINAQYQPSPSTILRAWLGMAEDNYSFVDASGNITVLSQATDFVEEDSEMNFYVVEGTQYLVPEKFYVAGRYSMVSNESDNTSGDTDLERVQLGIGWWVAENALVKAEYVRQTEGDASPGQIGSDWDGFSAEVSVKF